MARFTHELTLHNEIDEIFSYVSNPVNNPVWDTSILETAMNTEDTIGVGTTGRSVSTFLGKTYETNYTYNEYEPPASVVHRTTAEPLEVTMSSGLEPVRNGIKLTLEIDIKLKGGRKLLEPVIARKIRSKIVANLAALQVYFRFIALKRF